MRDQKRRRFKRMEDRAPHLFDRRRRVLEMIDSPPSRVNGESVDDVEWAGVWLAFLKELRADIDARIEGEIDA